MLGEMSRASGNGTSGRLYGPAVGTVSQAAVHCGADSVECEVIEGGVDLGANKAAFLEDRGNGRTP